MFQSEPNIKNGIQVFTRWDIGVAIFNSIDVIFTVRGNYSSSGSLVRACREVPE